MVMQTVLDVQELTTLLKLEGSCFPVVRGISFKLYEGQTLALVGETGCGKSMTALSLLGIAPQPPTLPSTGQVLYQDKNLLTLPKQHMRSMRGRHLAMIFQDPRSCLNPVCTLGEQLLETCYAHLKISHEQAYQRCLHVLEEVQLSHPEMMMKTYPHQLSGGMLQRAMIAMALICEPNILIADEPTTALDVTIQKQILQLLKEIQNRRGMSILLITHDMGVVAELAHHLAVLYAGEIIEHGSTQAIFQNPAHPYTQALFAARPNRPLKEGRLPVLEGHVPSARQLPSGCPFHPRCVYQMPQCTHEAPSYFALPNPSHHAKCWLFDPTLAWRVDADPSF
ncbi:MAG: ABC transporter ATP-binding protein [Verrucomicrobia bacterium]|nr:ABC transporter ATP-binding protein [Verrucomicrobiota bacterium]MBS0645673.1 ABC transporter ATP-binding protein [Verrucomicrobiota bacterium]